MTSTRIDATTHGRILTVVRRIPRGRVATYGQIATLAGLARQPRLVGYALHALQPGSRVPWHRVINAAGMVSTRSRGTGAVTQRMLLEREGVRFDARGRVSLEQFRWRPTKRASPTSRPRMTASQRVSD
jgi:methylated-DNA-protein-cysteine methyltransferase-like protein